MAKIIDKLAWIELQDGKILSTRSKGKKVYYIPGGKREEGETDHQALIREINEELSVDLIESSLSFMGVFEAQADGHPEGVIVKMTCYTGSYRGTLKTAAEIEEMIWLNDKDRDCIAPIDQLIFDFLRDKGVLK